LKIRKLTIAIIIVFILLIGLIVGLVYYQQGLTGAFTRFETGSTTTATNTAPSGSSELELLGRKIVYNAWISLEVNNVDAAITQLENLANEFNGYPSSISVSKGEKIKTGSITLKVPQTEFFDAIIRVEQIGQVKNKNVNSEDVTQQYIDLTARLANAQREEKILLDLMNKATDVKDMLEIESELARVRGEIESYTGQLNFLENRIDYSTITVDLSEPSPPLPLPEVNWYSLVISGLSWLLLIVQGLVILVFVAIVPVTIAVLAYYLFRRRQRKKQAST
jgi:hypothetical protein